MIQDDSSELRQYVHSIQSRTACITCWQLLRDKTIKAHINSGHAVIPPNELNFAEQANQQGKYTIDHFGKQFAKFHDPESKLELSGLMYEL